MKTKLQILKEIARKHLRVQQLTSRNSDQLDFYDCGCANIKDALEEAYDLGKNDSTWEMAKRAAQGE